MKILYLGPLWDGSTAFQRCEAMRRVPSVDIVAVDSSEPWCGTRTPLVDSILHRFRWPRDRGRVRKRLPGLVAQHRPDVVFVDSVKVLTGATFRAIEAAGAPKLVFYTPDDIIASHNSSRQLEASYRRWDLFFTTKTFNIPELGERGVHRPRLIGNAYDPEIHRACSRDEVGPDFERFDVVLVATWEAERMQSVNRLANAGLSVVVVGNGWKRWSPPLGAELRPPAFGAEYARALHWGRLCLCPLRKINRDRVTTRSVEIPGACRPLLAEKTDEHDAMFVDGVEYASYRDDDELVAAAQALLADPTRRQRLAEAGHRRCLTSRYSVDDRAGEMVAAIRTLL